MNDYSYAAEQLAAAERNQEAAPFADKVYALAKSLERATRSMERYSKALGAPGIPPREKREIGEGLAGVIEESQRRVEELTELIDACRHLIG